MHLVKRLTRFVILGLTALGLINGSGMLPTGCSQQASAQQPSSQQARAPASDDLAEIPLRSLPPPPPEVKPWLEAGNVRIEFGPKGTQLERTGTERRESASDRRAAGQQASDAPRSARRDQPRGDQDSASGGSGPAGRPPALATETPALAAETRYRIEFHCDLKTTWEWLPASRELRITASVNRLHWQPFHTIWFRERPQTDGFWSNPLVRHELDHVRLSSDPSMKGRFAASLDQPFVIRHRLTGRQRVNPELVNRLANEYMQERFEEILELIDLRYQELDRATGHGRSALGQESSVYPLLREPVAESVPPTAD